MSLQTLDRVHLRRVTEEMVSLPTLPRVARRLLEVVADPATPSEELARILSLDPSLTGRTLKLANSDFYGFPRRVGSVDLAVVVLGSSTVRDLVLSAAVFQALDPDGIELEGLWNHSMACAVAARLLAERSRYRLGGEAYAAGILHDIGKVALRQCFPERFDAVLALARSQGLAMIEAERGVFGSDHAEVGAWLAARWGLPDDLVEAVAFHHRPEGAVRNRELTALVHVANALAERTGHAWPSGVELPPLAPEAWESIQPDERLRDGLVQELAEHVCRAMEQERAVFLQFRAREEE